GPHPPAGARQVCPVGGARVPDQIPRGVGAVGVLAGPSGKPGPSGDLGPGQPGGQTISGAEFGPLHQGVGAGQPALLVGCDQDVVQPLGDPGPGSGELLHGLVQFPGQVLGPLGLAVGRIGQALDLVAAVPVDQVCQAADHAALLFAGVVIETVEPVRSTRTRVRRRPATGTGTVCSRNSRSESSC